jgi:hypothetical protein
LADGAVDHIGFGVLHLQGDGDIGDGSQLDRASHFVHPALQAGRWAGSLGRRIVNIVDHLLGAGQFLLSDE